MEERFKDYVKLVREMRKTQEEYQAMATRPEMHSFFHIRSKKEKADELQKAVDKYEMPWEDISKNQLSLL
jgi:hypothetical protein